MSTSDYESKPEKLPIEERLSRDEINARLLVAALQLLDENILPGSVTRALELDIDPKNNGANHQQYLRTKEMIGEFASEAENKLPPTMVREIKYPPSEKPTPKPRHLALPAHHIEQLIGRTL